jgi:hypothetical protein
MPHQPGPEADRLSEAQQHHTIARMTVRHALEHYQDVSQRYLAASIEYAEVTDKVYQPRNMPESEWEEFVAVQQDALDNWCEISSQKQAARSSLEQAEKSEQEGTHALMSANVDAIKTRLAAEKAIWEQERLEKKAQKRELRAKEKEVKIFKQVQEFVEKQREIEEKEKEILEKRLEMAAAEDDGSESEASDDDDDDESDSEARGFDGSPSAGVVAENYRAFEMFYDTIHAVKL